MSALIPRIHTDTRFKAKDARSIRMQPFMQTVSASGIMVFLAVFLGVLTTEPIVVLAQQPPTLGLNPWPSAIGGPQNGATRRRAIANEAQVVAQNYYQRLATTIAFPYNSTDLQSNTMDDLFPYLGYNNWDSAHAIDARALEVMKPLAAFPDSPPTNVLSKELMLYYLQINESILVSRFFAPKIVNYAVLKRPYDAGWRKLVYMKALPNSPASNNNISGAYILFNYFQTNPTSDPFGGAVHATSGNNQVILVPRSKLPDRDTAFFVVYKGADAPTPYQIGFSLAASFDIPTQVGEEESPLKEYFVPNACAHCHGQADGKPKNGVFANVKPNYLDTDQWYDAERLDFPAVKNAPFDPVFDGGRDHNSEQYKRAMNALRKINAQIKIDGTGVETTVRDGLDKWQQLHGLSNANPISAHLPVSTTLRGVDSMWTDHPYDVELLDMMTQYCFRCHGSIKYNVFDKQAVIHRARAISFYIDNEADRSKPPIMPYGRTIPLEDRECMKALVTRLSPDSVDAQIINSTCAHRFCPADFDRNGDVDIADHATLLAAWGNCSSNVCPQDLTGDLKVDTEDMANLFTNWGACPQP